MGFGRFEKRELVELIEDSMWSAYRRHHSREGMEGREEKGLSWVLTPGRNEGINGVFNVKLDPDRADAEIDRINELFRQNRVRPYWWVSTLTEPGDMPQRLAARGLREEEFLHGMALDLTRPLKEIEPPEGLELISIGNPDLLKEMMDLFPAAFDMSDLECSQEYEVLLEEGFGPESIYRHFAGRLDGRIVSSASFYRRGPAVTIDCVSTASAHRDRGFAKALLSKTLHQAVQEGFPLALVQGSEMGRPLYASMGFEEVCGFSIWSKRPARSSD